MDYIADKFSELDIDHQESFISEYIEITDDNYINILYDICSCDHLISQKCLEHLVYHISPDKINNLYGGGTSLMVACNNASLDCVTEILNVFQNTINFCDVDGNTALLHLLNTEYGSHKNTHACLILLLDHGANIHHINKHGLSALSFSIYHDPIIMKTLFEGGFDIKYAQKTIVDECIAHIMDVDEYCIIMLVENGCEQLKSYINK